MTRKIGESETRGSEQEWKELQRYFETIDLVLDAVPFAIKEKIIEYIVENYWRLKDKK